MCRPSYGRPYSTAPCKNRCADRRGFPDPKGNACYEGTDFSAQFYNARMTILDL